MGTDSILFKKSVTLPHLGKLPGTRLGIVKCSDPDQPSYTKLRPKWNR